MSKVLLVEENTWHDYAVRADYGISSMKIIGVWVVNYPNDSKPNIRRANRFSKDSSVAIQVHGFWLRLT